MKISIVGAGPVGCRTAELLAKSGHKVQVFEEHQKVGLPEHCTGIVSPRLLEVVKTKSVINKAKYAQIFGKTTKLEVKGTAYVIDRPKFDKERYKAAKKAGVQFFFNTRVRFDGKDLHHLRQRIQSDLIIAADGARSQIRSYYHLPSQPLSSAQYLVSGKFQKEKVEIHIWPHHNNPGLFTWVVPQSNKLAKIGLACPNPKQVLDNFIKKRIPNGKIKKVMAGTVLIGGPVRQDFGRVKLVGDAAGHVKATTAGGLVAGLMCAEKLAESINSKKSYTRLCRPVLNQLRLAQWLRFFWNRLSPHTQEPILKAMAKNVKHLEKTDMDWHSSNLIRIAAKEIHLIPRILIDLIF
jgi:geranylgeranyl reductase family protein